jgi:hypothetical protein
MLVLKLDAKARHFPNQSKGDFENLLLFPHHLLFKICDLINLISVFAKGAVIAHLVLTNQQFKNAVVDSLTTFSVVTQDLVPA